MRKMLEEFYLGNIVPSERRISQDSDLLRATEHVYRCEQQLREQLDESGQTVLTELVGSQHDIDSIMARENFILGFRLGVRMMAECMDEDDGDTRRIEEAARETERQAGVGTCEATKDSGDTVHQKEAAPAVSGEESPV